jgi:transposase-like protein
MKEKKGKRELATAEYLRGEISYRDLGKKYGVSHTTIAKWIEAVLVKERLEKPGGLIQQTPALVVLQKELRAAQLRNKLLEAMLDIGKEKYGIDLRKKSGPKQS